MVEIDDEYLVELLRKYVEPYPSAFVIPKEERLFDQRLNAHVVYLQEHGMVAAVIKPVTHGNFVAQVTVTAKGRDYLREDGGMTAKQRVVTIRLESDTIKAMMLARVDKLDADQSAKEQMRAAIREMPASMLKQATEFVFAKGLEVISISGLVALISN